jgi:hypothetical protein
VRWIVTLAASMLLIGPATADAGYLLNRAAAVNDARGAWEDRDTFPHVGASCHPKRGTATQGLRSHGWICHVRAGNRRGHPTCVGTVAIYGRTERGTYAFAVRSKAGSCRSEATPHMTGVADSPFF